MFSDRVDAAKKLCPKLKKFKSNGNTAVVGLLRGGIVTAKVISDTLLLPLRPLIVKKIGAPLNSELALGAIVSDRDVFWNRDIYEKSNVTKEMELSLIDEKMREIKNLKKELKIGKDSKVYDNVIVVDDGVATGATVMAALKYLKRNRAKKIILATPVIAFDTLSYLRHYFDDIVFLEKPKDFYAVSEFYANFPQVTNNEVKDILNTQ